MGAGPREGPGLDGDLSSNRLEGAVWQMDSGRVYPGLPLRESNNNPCARPHIRASSARPAAPPPLQARGGPVQLVSTACPSLVRGRFIIIIISVESATMAHSMYHASGVSGHKRQPATKVGNKAIPRPTTS
jgi:hypothetical protein